MSNELKLADRRVTEWFSREQARREQEREQPPRHPERIPVITISRQVGSGGHTVAEMLAKRLGPPWEVWDRQLVEQVALNAKVRADMVALIDERVQNVMADAIRRIFSVEALEALAYRRHLAEVLLAVGLQGHIIVVGRGANFVLEAALNVRLRAPERFRVENTIRDYSVNREEAQRRVRAIDAERAKFTKSIFGREIDDPDAYEMVLRTDTLGIEAVVDAILAVYTRRFAT